MIAFLRAVALALLLPAAAVAQPAGPSAISPGGDVSNTTVLAPGSSVARTEAARAGDIVWAKDYGVKCDGITDDSAAIANAVSIASAASRELRLPAGNCIINSQLVFNNYNTYIAGEGKDLTTITVNYAGTAGQGALVFTPPVVTGGLQRSQGRLRDLTIRRTSSDTAGIGLQLIQFVNFHIDNVSINNFFIGFDLSAVSNVFFNNVGILEGAYYGSLQVGSKYGLIRTGYSTVGGARRNSVGVFFTGSSFVSGGTLTIEHGLEITGADGVYMNGSNYIGEAQYNEYIRLEDTSTGTGLYISNLIHNGVFFDGNNSESQNGVYVAYNSNNTTSSISNLNYNGVSNTTDVYYAYYFTSNDITGVSITGGVVGGNTGTCMNFIGGEKIAVSGVLFNGCGATNSLTNAAIYFQNPVGAETVTGNVFANMASGSPAIRINANNAAFFTVTGNSFMTSNTTKGLEIYLSGAVPHLEQFGNVTVNAGGVANISSGHVGFTGGAPVLSACGTTPSIDANASDTAGTITEGTTATGCTATFALPYTTAPHCSISSPGAAPFTSYSTSTTALTIVNASASNNQYSYVCAQ